LQEVSVLETVLAYIPHTIAAAVTNAAALHGRMIDEIRLYRNAQTAVVIAGKNITLPIVCDGQMMDETVCRLCGESLYAHADTIRNGYIFTPAGFRVGVSGRAICDCESVERVTDITSLCIRVPYRFPGCADDLFCLATEGGVPHSMLIWSPPGVGKTTALRELAYKLAASHVPYRTAVIDSRYELVWENSVAYMDIFRGYPRARGMEIAVRTMNPQFVLCDEIANVMDAEAVLQCAASGAAVIASAHGASVEDLQRQSAIRCLLDNGVFQFLIGLSRLDGRVIHMVHRGSCV
jgi:stage III sporulation protein AA